MLRLGSQNGAKDGLGLIEAAKFAQIRGDLGLHPDVIGVDGANRLELRQRPSPITAPAQHVTETDQCPDMLRLAPQNGAKDRVCLVEAVELAQIGGDLDLHPDLVGVDGCCRLVLRQRPSPIAAPAQQLTEPDQCPEMLRLALQRGAKDDFRIIKVA
jgi:hypothetical protein